MGVWCVRCVCGVFSPEPSCALSSEPSSLWGWQTGLYTVQGLVLGYIIMAMRVTPMVRSIQAQFVHKTKAPKHPPHAT